MTTAACRGEILLGDLIRALASLPGSTPAHAQAIAGCLGFGIAAPTTETSERETSGSSDHNRPPGSAAPSPRPQEAARRPPGFAAPSPPPPLPAESLPSELEDLPPVAVGAREPPKWLNGSYRLFDPTPAIPPPRATLFPRHSARGVLTAALATTVAGQEIDLGRLVEAIGRGEPLHRLPRLPVWTLNHGCQLLLDFSEQMQPWWQDLHELTAQIEGLLGSERVARYAFDLARTPASRRTRDDEQAIPWQPVAGKAVVVASGLGLPGSTAVAPDGGNWRDFARRCAAAGSPLRVLVPWSREYWPRALGASVELVHWHPGTNAATLRRQLARRGR